MVQRGAAPRSQEVTPAMASAKAVAEWLAHLGMHTKLQASSIRTYRSAISTWWSHAQLDDEGPAPGESRAAHSIIKGIERKRVAQKGAAGAAAEQVRSIAMTPALLAQLEPIIGPRTGDAHTVMRWAAANVGTYAMLRPGELLGAHSQRERALRPEQITFFACESIIPMRLLPWGTTPLSGEDIPDRFEIALGVTKADQRATNAPHPVAAAPAVRALWTWMHMRRDRGPAEGSELFRVPGEQPLSVAELCSTLEAALKQLTGTPHKVTGKAFRMGGATSLMADRAPRDVMMAAGRWASDRMPEVYATIQSQRLRQMDFSRGMAPAAAAAGRS